LKISVENSERLSLEQMQAFLEASGEVDFEATDKQERYDWVRRALVGQEYGSLGREAKGVVRRYI
jgi:hypothetical protein